MSDITYCSNVNCPFESCERNLRRLPSGAYRDRLVSIADFAGTCREYIWFLVNQERGEDDD